MLVDLGPRRAGAEAVHADEDAALRRYSGPSRSASAASIADARRGAEHLRRDSPRSASRTAPSTASRRPRRACPASRKTLAASIAERDFRSRGEQRQIARAVRLAAAHRRPSRRGSSRSRCASVGRFCRESASADGRRVSAERELPAFGGLDRVAGPEHVQVRHRAQRSRAARSADASGRPRRGRSNRASARRSPGCPSARTAGSRRAHSRRR